jgi:hypothetical protein
VPWTTIGASSAKGRATGRRRSPATLPGFHVGHAPGNKGLRYPADPPKVEEIVAVMPPHLGVTSVYLHGIDSARSSRPCTPDAHR